MSPVSKVALLLLLGAFASIAADAQLTAEAAGVEGYAEAVGDSGMAGEVLATQDDVEVAATLWKRAHSKGKCIYGKKMVDCKHDDDDDDESYHSKGGDDSEGRKHEESPYIAYLKNYKSGSKKSHSSKDTKHAYREYDHSGDEDSGYDGYPGGYRRNGPPEDRHYYPMDMEARVETVNKGPTSSKGLWAYGWSSSRSYGGAEHRKYVAKHAKHSKYHSA